MLVYPRHVVQNCSLYQEGAEMQDKSPAGDGFLLRVAASFNKLSAMGRKRLCEIFTVGSRPQVLYGVPCDRLAGLSVSLMPRGLQRVSPYCRELSSARGTHWSELPATCHA